MEVVSSLVIAYLFFTKVYIKNFQAVVAGEEAVDMGAVALLGEAEVRDASSTHCSTFINAIFAQKVTEVEEAQVVAVRINS